MVNLNYDKISPYRKRKSYFFIKDFFVGNISAILVTASVLLGILGTYHSCTKHDDGDFIRFSPLVLYRGVEFFWHNDFAGVNWGEKLQDDAMTCIQFLNLSTDRIDASKNLHEMNKNIEEFSKEIKKYPKDKIGILKKVSNLYFQFTKTTVGDMKNAMKDYFNSGQANLTYSGKIIELINEIKKYLRPEYGGALDEGMKVSYKQVNESFLKNDASNQNAFDAYSTKIELMEINMESNIRATYRKLFGEELKK